MTNENKVSIAKDACIEGLNIAVLTDNETYKSACKAVEAVESELKDVTTEDISKIMSEIRHETNVIKLLNGYEITLDAFEAIADDDRLKHIDVKKDIKREEREIVKADKSRDTVIIVTYPDGLNRKTLDLYRYVRAKYDGDNSTKVLKAVGALERARSLCAKYENICKVGGKNATDEELVAFARSKIDVADKEKALNKMLPAEFLQTYESEKANYDKAVSDSIEAQFDVLQSLSSVLKVRRAEIRKIERKARNDARKDKVASLNSLWKSIINDDKTKPKPKRARAPAKKKSAPVKKPPVPEKTPAETVKETK